MQRIREKRFNVPVVAMTKCGKSTFHNCTLLSSALPEDALPETSAIVTIHHDPRARQPELFRSFAASSAGGQPLATGEQEVYNFLKDLNAFLREAGRRNEAEEGPPQSDRFDLSMQRLVLRANVAALDAFAENDVVFCLQDTPGVNEYNRTVIRTTQELLQQADVIIYIIDITRIGTNDEHNFLSTLVGQRPDLLSQGRVFFLLNKVDEVSYSAETIERAHDYIRQFLHNLSPDLAELANDNTFALSTRDFLISTLALEHRIHLREHEILLAQWIYGRNPPEHLVWPLDDRALQMLQRVREQSRFLSAERAIMESLSLNAPCLFATAIVGNLHRACFEIKNGIALRRSMWELGRDQVQRTIDALQRSVSTAREFISWLSTTAEAEGSAVRGKVAERGAKVLRCTLQRTVASCVSGSTHAFMPQNKQEDAALALQNFLDRLRAGIQAGIALEKAQMDLELRERLEQFKHKAENSSRARLLDVIVDCLRQVLPAQQVDDIRRQLDAQPIWTTGQASEWQGTPLDLQSVGKAYLVDVEETVHVKKHKFVPAKKETKPAPLGGGGGGVGGILRHFLAGAATGAAIGSVLGHPGAAIGAAIGGLGSVYAGQKTSRVAQRTYDVEVEPARMVEETVDEKVTKYMVDQKAVEASAMEVANTTAQAFVEWYGQQVDAAFGELQTTVREHYERRLTDLIAGLERDREQQASDARSKEQHLAELAVVADEADRLLALLGQPIEQILI